MKKIFLFLILVMAGSLKAQMTIAITDFRNQSETFNLDTWEKSVAEYLKADLSRSDQLIIVERENLGAVLKEQALGQTGILDAQTAQEIGGLLGARYVITGSIIRNNDQVDIHAQIIQVSSGQLHSERVSAPDDRHFNEMMQLRANNIRFDLLGQPDYRKEISLKPYPTGYFLGATVLLATGTLISANAYNKKLDSYRSAEDLGEFDDSYDSANRLYKIRNAMTIVTGVALAGTVYCWIRNQSAGSITAGEEQTGLMINRFQELLCGRHPAFLV
jgi:TolB-like protein